MHEIVTQQAAALPHGAAPAGAAVAGAVPAAAPLVHVLWRRRWTLVISVAASLCLAALYLILATPVYRASSKVIISQNAPKVFAENAPYAPASETFSETQRDVFRSAAVLSRTLVAIDYRKMRMFADVPGDPVTYLQTGNGFDVDTAPKSDVLVISMESRYPQEAVDFVDGVVKAYIAEQAGRDRANGAEMLQVLHKEREELEAKRQATLQAMVKSQQASGIMSFRANENGNIMLERATSLSAALTNSQMAAFEFKAQQQSIQRALSSAASIAAFVQGLQYKSRDSGDREYDELRSQLVQQRLVLQTLISVQGRRHPTVQVEEARVEVLREQVAQKERAIVEAQLASVSDQLEAARQQEAQLKEALAGEKQRASELNPEQARYSLLEGDAAQIQKQIDILDHRAAEVSANNIEAAPMNVHVLDWASADKSPVRPRKGLTMLAGLAAGWLAGIGAAMFRDWQDARVRTPKEALALMGAPILAVVPRVDAELLPAARGQLVHLNPLSPAAEAYRSIRTSLSAGAAREAKTVLIASGSREDGKSMTAANLAITFAHAGHRTLLLDCDLRQPVQHLIFQPDDDAGAPNGEGLTSALSGEVRISSIIYPTQVPGLCVLPCGPVPANPSELLAGKRFEQLLDSLAASFDRVVIDSSSLASVSDARSLAALADVTLMVVRMNRSTRALCMMTMDSLLRVGANVAGVIANDVPMPRGQSEYYALGGTTPYGEPRRRARRTLAGGGGAPRLSPGTAPGVVMAIDEPNWSDDDGAPPGNDRAPSGDVSQAAKLPDLGAGSNGTSSGNGTGHGA
jgi:capsular exopolysaccharide synthesis family protein